MSLPQEAKIERQAVGGLNSAAAGSRCATVPASAQEAVARRVGLLLPLTRQLASTGIIKSAVASPRTPQRGATPHKGNAGRPEAGSEPPTSRFKSATIAPPEHGGLNWLLFALLIAGCVLAVWLLESRLRVQPEAAGVAQPRRPVPRPQSLRSGAKALATAIGLVALRGAITERRSRPRGVDADPRAALAPALEDRAPVTPEHVGDAPAGAAAIAAFEVGAALAQKGDFGGAEAAYRRADERGTHRAPPTWA